MATPKVKLAELSRRLETLEQNLSIVNENTSRAFALLEAFLTSKGVFTREEFLAFIETLKAQHEPVQRLPETA